MYLMNCIILRKPEEAKVPLVSPVFAEKKELEGLPKTIICYADQDNLKARRGPEICGDAAKCRCRCG